MEDKFISLLYPSEESRSRHSDRNNLPNISEDVCCELGLDEIFKLKNSRLSDFFTSDSEVIRYRQKVILDMLNIPELKDTLSSVHPILDDIRELQRLDSESPNAADSYLYTH